jgi:hypothetical protein
MNYQVIPEPDVVFQRIRRRRINPGYRFPSVSIFMPFDPKMEMKNKLTFSLSKATDIVVSELRDKYPGEMSLLVIQKLKAIIKKLNFNTHKKSLAIFVSPVFKKIYYHNIDVEEKVIVNESLQIRDLLYSKKQSQKFHILLLNEKASRIFLSDTNSSVKIIPEGFVSQNTCPNDSTEQAGYLPDTVAGKEIAIEKFLHYVDHSLDNILKSDRLPVFVMGTEKLVGQFKNITKSNEAIIKYVHGDYEKCALEDLKELLKSHIADWQKIKQKNLLDQLKEAANKNKLSFGIEDVRSEVINRGGRLLLLEKQYLYDNLYDTNLLASGELSYKTAELYNKFSCIKNPIDEMIEKVLENGGDVELVSNGLLKEYSQIALIKDFEL